MQVQQANHRVTVMDDCDDKRRQYFAYKLLFANPRLSLYATTIWEAVQLDETGKKAVGEPVIIKESWRQLIHPSKLRHCQDMREAVGAAPSLSRIADSADRDDLGLCRTNRLSRDSLAVSTVDGMPFSGSLLDLEEDEIKKFRSCAADILGYRTVCRPITGLDHNRGHVRIALKYVGKPVTEFHSMREMVTALGAVTGREAYTAGNIHGYVSRGDVIMLKKADSSAGGFFHDSDFASNWVRFLKAANLSPNLACWTQYAMDAYADLISQKKKAAGEREDDDYSDDDTISERKGNQERPKAKATGTSGVPLPRVPALEHKDEGLVKMVGMQKQCTGTTHFLAIEGYFSEPSMMHEARHDLESFFWLLIWIVLRHTSYRCHDDRIKHRTWHALFDGPRLVDRDSSKQAWLTNRFRFVTVKDNPPLTKLLGRFRQCCQKNFNRRDLVEPWMTHADVLRLFDRALAKPHGWPQNDEAIPWLPLATRLGGIMGEVDPGAFHPKGTLAVMKPNPQCAPHRPSGKIVAHPNAVDQPDDDDNETTSKSDIKTQDGAADKVKVKVKEKAAACKIPRKRDVMQLRDAGQTSTTTASTSQSNGSGFVHHPSGYNLRSSNKSFEGLRKTAGSNARSMRPPSDPLSHSGASRSQSSSRSALVGPSMRRTGAMKRSRAHEDEAGEDAASTSHPSKRSRTLSQRSTEQAKKSRRASSNKRAA